MPRKYKSVNITQIDNTGGRTFPMKGKTRSLPPQSADSIPSATSSRLDPEAEDQFEIELCWCIQHLEAALISGKLNERQIQHTKKTLSVLSSNTAPLVKKRHVMSTTFGNYREKMANDQKKLGKVVAQVNFIPKKDGPKKYMFLKKAAVKQPILDSENVESREGDSFSFRNLSAGNSFKFNFSEPEGK